MDAATAPPPLRISRRWCLKPPTLPPQLPSRAASGSTAPSGQPVPPVPSQRAGEVASGRPQERSGGRPEALMMSTVSSMRSQRPSQALRESTAWSGQTQGSIGMSKVKTSAVQLRMRSWGMTKEAPMCRSLRLGSGTLAVCGAFVASGAVPGAGQGGASSSSSSVSPSSSLSSFSRRACALGAKASSSAPGSGRLGLAAASLRLTLKSTAIRATVVTQTTLKSPAMDIPGAGATATGCLPLKTASTEPRRVLRESSEAFRPPWTTLAASLPGLPGAGTAWTFFVTMT
mmetsp:Transcript_58350/g.181245  ORF Transcript_58350/g.181245 Transcript_58350/m.181245 type:complete len:287 (-) Transcript_58350:213-1073(-)